MAVDLHVKGEINLEEWRFAVGTELHEEFDKAVAKSVEQALAATFEHSPPTVELRYDEKKQQWVIMLTLPFGSDARDPDLYLQCSFIDVLHDFLDEDEREAHLPEFLQMLRKFADRVE